VFEGPFTCCFVADHQGAQARQSRWWALSQVHDEFIGFHPRKRPDGGEPEPVSYSWFRWRPPLADLKGTAGCWAVGGGGGDEEGDLACSRQGFCCYGPVACSLTRAFTRRLVGSRPSSRPRMVGPLRARGPVSRAGFPRLEHRSPACPRRVLLGLGGTGQNSPGSDSVRVTHKAPPPGRTPSTSTPLSASFRHQGTGSGPCTLLRETRPGRLSGGAAAQGRKGPAELRGWWLSFPATCSSFLYPRGTAVFLREVGPGWASSHVTWTGPRGDTGGH